MSELGIEIKEELERLAEPGYREFHARLLPGIDPDHIMGVRVPKLRAMAKKAAKADWRGWLEESCGDTYEEIMIQGMVIGYAKMDEEEQRRRLDAFLPKINNWAVCDCCTSTWKFLAKDPGGWYPYILSQMESGSEYKIRFGAVALMDYYINDEWIDQVLEIYDTIQHEGYYVKMAVAWGISMCYVKYPKKTGAFLKKNHLDNFTQNKAIQKIRESYRVSREEKEELNQLKRRD